MNQSPRAYVAELADRAILRARSKQDCEMESFAEYLRDRCIERLDAGRSADCDELRCLASL